MTRIFRLSTSAAAFALLAGSSFAKDKLTVYTAIEADQYPAYLESFAKAHPDIEIEIVRDSTGIVTAKLLAEKAKPVADVVWGLAATSLMLLDEEGLLMAHAPKGLEAIKPAMRDAADPPSWVGLDVWSSAICFNTVEAGKKSVPVPASWADLTNPAYKGHVVMPNPASSGTGYLMVSAWLQMMGEEKAWAFMDALHQNIATYTHSGSKPCKQAAAGEFTVGLSFEYRANKSKKEGAPLAIILPSEGLGWDMEAIAIMAATDAPQAAKTFTDWAVSPEAMALYAANFAIVAVPGIQKPLEFVPATIEDMLIDNDFAWAAANRERVLAEWSKRYDGKSEPK